MMTNDSGLCLKPKVMFTGVEDLEGQKVRDILFQISSVFSHSVASLKMIFSRPKCE